MRISIVLAVLCGLLLFVADAHAGKAKCKDGSCSVEKSKAKTAVVANSATTETRVKHNRRERVREGRGLHLRLPRLFRKGCKSC